MPENTPELFTERLILRRFTQQDIPALFEIYRDEQANTFLPWFPLKTPAQAEELFLRQYAAAYQKPQGYRYAICQKQDNIPIGYVHVGMGPAHDFGYGLRSDFWHQGFATEAGGAVIARLRQDGLPFLTATHDIANPRSGQVMRRLGMRYAYTYEEQWQPKNLLVRFRMYQLNLADPDAPVYSQYWEDSAVHFVEQDLL